MGCGLGLALSLAATHAAPLNAENFVTALETAKKQHHPVVVYVHGSSWHGASRLIHQKIWSEPGFIRALNSEAILTEIHVRQQLDEPQRKKSEEAYQGWKSGTVSTYPAIQIYGEDGHLLKTLQGREFRTITSPSALVSWTNRQLDFAHQRQRILADLAEARKKNDRQQEVELLVKLVELPIEKESKIVEQLKQADPEDLSGWQARLSFKNWDFVRHVSNLIAEEKTAEALAETDRLLQSPHFVGENRALIYGARGKVLVAQGDLQAAWEAFQEARKLDPESASTKAIWRYGTRVAGVPLRLALPTDSSLPAQEIGENISRDRATFTASSQQEASAGGADSLFSGPTPASGFAFHTSQEKGAHIVIDLHGSCEVRALRIANRDSQGGRAASLTLWTSQDGRQWQQQWTAEKAQSAWDVLLEKPVEARYLKLGIAPDRSEYFHLKAVDVYGVRK